MRVGGTLFFSLRNRLLLIFTCLLTIPFIILSIMIPSLFTSVIREQTQDLTIEMMDQYLLYVESITTQAQDISKQVLVNETTQEWLRITKNSPQSEERVRLQNQLNELLSSVMINNSNGISISVQLNDGTSTWGYNDSLDETDWFQDFTEKEQQRFVISHLDPYQPNQEMSIRPVNSYLLPLIDTNTFIQSGVIKVNFPTTLLESAIKEISIGKNGNTYLIDKHGENVLTGELDTPNEIIQESLDQIKNNIYRKGLIKIPSNREEYLVFYQKLPVGDWILISEVTKSDLFSKVNRLQRNLLITSVFVFILTIVASFVLSSTITGPLGKLAKAMRFIEIGDFIGAKRLMPTIKSQNNEVSYLIKVTEHTVDQLTKLIETEYKANLRRKDAEYKALLLQINPHFLNNTLEIMGSLAIQGKNKEVMNVSIYLGKMLRYSLNTKSKVVELGEELNYIKNYTDILKLRYEEMININMEIDPETKTLPIIKFILQPLVENAVKYSFSERAEATIFIKTETRDNQIKIVIEDKGVGMSDKVLSSLLETDEEVNVLDSKGNSIGLRNVLGRLNLYYGQDFTYEIESILNEGTKITLCIGLGRGDIHDKGTNY
ncbi:two-component system, sensor histidine kinase YesM [Psychrobacillus psychrotolerans]|uniref:Two-component system, sensor histidine kinase YesM n=1 Tax=Psychrobacillus psychrotolerans TaxID=126156 RepID=A0A1I6AJZ6_9BACI|nr:sensor histidine kinase [Psychrobacillus psychrotolerans]SFQ69042.1 two-component system, sensor histidine kinase YesM [Psychrobacillus psychrotolerans]